MSKPNTLILLCAAISLPGCSESTSAESSRPESDESETTRKHTTRFEHASNGPDGKQETGSIVVEIVEARIKPYLEGLDQAPPGTYFLALEVRITSDRQYIRPRVEPRRFALRPHEGPAIQPLNGVRGTLISTYLNTGDSITGWLTFTVPNEAESLRLWSDLQQPPLELEVPVSGPAG